MSLTLTEMRVLEEALKPKCIKEIAQTLYVEPRTIKFHLSNLYRKLGCQSRIELIYRYK